MLFKIAAVSFPMCAPDVHLGAPTRVTGFVAAGCVAACGLWKKERFAADGITP
jgi:NADH:ubiquinone oxidoreductase subunit 2 (subunit N)